MEMIGWELFQIWVNHGGIDLNRKEMKEKYLDINGCEHEINLFCATLVEIVF